MRIADASQVKELALWSSGWCVSAFLPLHRVRGNDGSDSLRLKNLIRTAEAELTELGVRRAHIDELFADAVPPELSDPTSEVFHRAGVGVFIAPGISRTYRLTLDAHELVTVSPRFHLKPLLREIGHDRRFFLLALTRGHARLYAGGREEIRPVAVADMPASLDDAIQYDDRERALLSHSASRRGVGGVVAAFHGQGDRADHFPEDLSRYVRMVDAAVCSRVSDTTPVVLAGSGDLLALYRELSGHGCLAGEDIFGNPETMVLPELHERAWGIVDDGSDEADRDRAEFERVHGTGLASASRTEVLEAAAAGRVAVLFAGSDAQTWGRFDDDGPVIHDSRWAGDEDLLDRAAVDAWKTGARVHVVPSAAVPSDGEVAAIFRY